MSTPEHEALVKRVMTSPAGSVVAAAGCGKTEAIVMVAQATVAANDASKSGKPLILTHTNAGVAALRARLKTKGVSESRVSLDTIAGWSQRFALSYPHTSGCAIGKPVGKQWSEIYAAATRLVQSGAVDRVLRASYSRVLVDEYQDCGVEQHGLCVALLRLLPVCVLGDPLQSIFDFDGRLIDWKAEVETAFPPVGTLTKPWRWVKADNGNHATWLEEVRNKLETGLPIDLSKAPETCSHSILSTSTEQQRARILGTCQERAGLNGRVIVIADSGVEGKRANIAKGLAKRGFTVLEPLDSKTLLQWAKKLNHAADSKRLSVAMEFMTTCFIGIERSGFQKAITSHKSGGKAGRKKFGRLIDYGIAVGEAGGRSKLLGLFQEFRYRDGAHCYRRELFAAMLAALKSIQFGEFNSMEEAVASTASRSHHLGRIIPNRGIGSTLLIKGLEFEHAIIVEYPGMTKADWYVALTRATKTVTVLSASSTIAP